MSRTLTILPDIGGEFLVQDFNDYAAIKTLYLPIIPREPFQITITEQDGINKSFKQIIKERLREIVEEAVEVGMASDINFLIEEEIGSPPIKIYREQNWIQAIKQRGNNTFQIVKIKDNKNGVTVKPSFGKERVFKLAPAELVYDKTKYFEPDRTNLLQVKEEEASCAFQYIYQHFGNRVGYKKKARDFKTIKGLSLKEPPQFRNWVTQYQKEYNLESLGLNTQYPVVELESFETELFNVEVLEIKEDNYTEEELINSMSVIDIMRWCMWAGVSCYVIDYDGHYYLSYNHNQLSKDYTDKKKTTALSVVLKVVNKHAYFVSDPNVKKSVATTLRNFKMEDFEDVGSGSNKKKVIEDDKPPVNPNLQTTFSEFCDKYEHDDDLFESELQKRQELEDKYDEDIKKWLEEKKNKFYLSPYFEIKNQIKNKNIYDEELWSPISDINPRDDLDGFILQLSTQLYKNNPPPLPDEFLKDENKTYYLEARSLNGIISYIKHNFNVSPNTMNGSCPHQIDRATYGKTKLMSRSCNSNNWCAEDIKGVDYLYKKYPKLSGDRLPTARGVAEAIMKDNYDDKQFWSMFNSNTKRAFMDCEIKADNRVIKERVNNDVFSLDLKRAYSNQLKNPDCRWGIYDGICQFEKYKQSSSETKDNFNTEYFYLVEEKDNRYPLRGIKGLVLYHGNFLQTVMDRVDIKFVIRPINYKEKDYFEPFVKACEEFEDETEGLITSKSLVNNFIGSFKNADSIKNYKIYETESNTTLTRAFYSGCIVSNLDRNTEWNRLYRFDDAEPVRLISNPITSHYVQSAQPIRLQIIDSINKIMYRLYLDYKIAFGKTPLVMIKTDALYIEDPKRTEEEIDEFCQSRCVLVEKEKWGVKKEDWDFKILPSTQRPVKRMVNFWRTTINIDKAWSLPSGAKAIYNLINTGGGAMINGEAGVGKSELTNYISTEFEENRKDYRWVRLIIGMTAHNPPEELEEWRDKRPCYAIKLAPTNKATNRIGGQTLNRGLGIPVMNIDTEDEEDKEDPVGYFEKKIARIIGGISIIPKKDGEEDKDKKTTRISDKPCFDFICIDEISMINGYFWSVLLAIKHRAPRIKFLLCGDIMRQLPPVGEDNRNFMNSYLIKELSNFQQINLNYNFRNKLSGNILWDNWSINPKTFKIQPQAPDTIINLCYLNKTRKRLIRYFNQILKPFGNRLSVYDYEGYAPFKKSHTIYQDDQQTDEIYYFVGTPMIANKSMKELGIAKNEMWNISSYSNGEITLKYEDKEVVLEEKEVYRNFYSGYAITIYKSQGDTYTDKYTIWDWDKLSKDSPLNRKLRYVAQSRSKEPDKNILYKV